MSVDCLRLHTSLRQRSIEASKRIAPYEVGMAVFVTTARVFFSDRG
jgi:hypothetical protein